MLAKVLAVVLLAEATLCQENVDTVRRLRFRRPRPKLIDVDNPDGDLRGSPVELRLAESGLSASVAEEGSGSSGSAALDALIATAQREKPVPQPQVLEIEEIPTQSPLRLAPAVANDQPIRGQRVRGRGGIPARRRPRPGQEQAGGQDADEPRRRPSGPKEEPVATLERYSHKNEDGSFTFGYVGADGSFREETRGVDCITRGKYGYIDPDGVKREYTYTSGLPCEVGDEDADLQNIDGDINVEDPVDPRERFRQTQNEQLTDAQIPAAARPRRPIQRRPAPAAEASPANTFSNFGANAAAPTRAQLPERRPVPARINPSAGGNALQTLQAIASGDSAAARPAPVPARAPVRIAPRPTQAASRPAAPVNQGTFDFDAELEGFTLNRPSLTFEQNAQKSPSSFQSQLSFNQNTGTFQTNLQQNVQGGQQISLSNNNAPSGAVPATTAAPQPVPTTFAPRPTPTSFPVRANPTQAPVRANPSPAAPVAPSNTFPLKFEPLNIPDISAVKVNLPPTTLAPKPTPSQPTQAPTPRPTQAPTQRPTPVRINLTEAPRQSQPVRIASPTPAVPAAPVTPAPTAPAAPASPATPAAPSAPSAPANTFFVFQPFNQNKPASAPFPTPVNPNAFQIRPAAQQPRPVVQQPRPAPPQPAQLRPAPPQPAQLRPVQPQPVQPRPVQPQPVQPRPVQPAQLRPAQPRPVQPQPVQPRPAQPQSVRPATPQLQFGFSPVQQPGQPQPRPVQPQPVRPPVGQPQQFQQRPQVFTAFRGQQPQQASRPVQQPQLGIPPQLQQQQRPAGAPQFAQFDSRFAPRPQGQAPGQLQFRPAQFTPGQPQQQFSVFNPAQQLRGA